ncbi:MAG: cell envelope integrity protein TolA [Clostridiales bacterium]|nr:cell envelope integrity protein TolA [Clostridiales bacterium]
MNIKGKNIKHMALGVGTVTEQSDTKITVQFKSKTSSFLYPDAFTNFIKAKDAALQEAILQEIEDAKIARAKKQADDAARIAYVRQKAFEEAERKRPAKRSASKAKTAPVQKRVAGKPLTFIVFQSKTYDKESRGGFIWAPSLNATGKKFHHWERLLEVQTGDIILHAKGGLIKGISIAKGECYDCQQPEELLTQFTWDKEGRKVDCDYTDVKYPVKTLDFVEKIISLCDTKYSPFNKNGGGNMGYLYVINRDLAKLFVEEMVKLNSNLEDIDYIKALISEE